MVMSGYFYPWERGVFESSSYRKLSSDTPHRITKNVADVVAEL